MSFAKSVKFSLTFLIILSTSIFLIGNYIKQEKVSDRKYAVCNILKDRGKTRVSDAARCLL